MIGVQSRSTLEHVRATNRTHTERALVIHCHMQGQSKTCTHANAVYPCNHIQPHVCSAMVFSYTAGPQPRDTGGCPVGTQKKTLWEKTNTTDSKKDRAAQGGCNVKTLPHTHKAAKQSRQQVATLTSKSKSLRTSPMCQGSVRANMPECRGTEAQWNTTADY